MAKEKVETIFVPGLNRHVPVDQIANINPDIDIRDATHFMSIHHTDDIDYNRKTEVFTRSLSTAHASIEFIARGEVEGHFGKHPVRRGMPIDFTEIKDDSERYNAGQKYDQKYGTSTVLTKILPVTEEHYSSSFEYAKQIKDSPSMFNVVNNNCNVFVNDVIQATGIPNINISKLYTGEELRGHGKLVTANVLANHGACDTSFTVSESIHTNVADKYKVPEDRILTHPVDPSNPDVRFHTIFPEGICPPKVEAGNVIPPNIRIPFLTKPPVKQEFIDILHAINPKEYPAKFKDWPTDSWGKDVVDRGDLETIRRYLPDYKQQLANKREAIELLHQINPQAYPVRYKDWKKQPIKKTLDSGDAQAIKKLLPVYRKNLKEKRLIDEFIDLSTKINPNGYPKDFRDWTDQWGKELVDRKDFNTIESLLPEYRKQLANKREAIELLHQINPEVYPARYKDWKKQPIKKTLDSGDAQAIEKLLPVYRKILAEKQAIDPYLTDPIGYVTPLMEGIMNSGSFEQLKIQCRNN